MQNKCSKKQKKMRQKVDNFIQDNNSKKLNKEPPDKLKKINRKKNENANKWLKIIVQKSKES